MVEIFLIAVSLALDAFAVSVSSGISIPGFGVKQAARMGLWFGAFQFMMPVAGLAAGQQRQPVHRDGGSLGWPSPCWPSSAARMAWGSLRGGEEDAAPADLSARRLCLLAIATSIDALAVGVSMAFMNVPVLASAVVIGVVAFVLSLVGGLVGKRWGACSSGGPSWWAAWCSSPSA